MLPGGVDEGGLVVSPPFADVPPGAFDGSATAALALRSAASADAGELGVAVDPATDGPEVPLTLAVTPTRCRGLVLHRG